jgi:hypothetical protein
MDYRNPESKDSTGDISFPSTPESLNPQISFSRRTHFKNNESGSKGGRKADRKKVRRVK